MTVVSGSAMCSRSVQPENACRAMAVSVCGSVTSESAVHSRNIPSLTRVMPSASTAVCKSTHSLKMYLPNERIVAGTVTLVRRVWEKALSPISVTPAGMEISVSPLAKKAFLPMTVTLSGMVMVSMPQEENTLSSSWVRLCGSRMLLSSQSPLNRLVPRWVGPSGIVTDASMVQPINARSPIVSTLAGSVTDVSDVQFDSACSPMVFTPSGNVMPVRYRQPFRACVSTSVSVDGRLTDVTVLPASIYAPRRVMPSPTTTVTAL